MLFERLRDTMELPFKDLSFANFAGLDISMDMIDVKPADKSGHG
jgi:hypothetical protein